MVFSKHTIFMALLLFTLLTIIGIISTYHTNWKSIKFSFIIVLLGILRLLIPFEHFNVIIINDKLFLVPLYNFFYYTIYDKIQVLHILCCIWILVAIVLLARLTIQLYKQWKEFRFYPLPDDNPLCILCHECAKRIGMTYTGTVEIHTDFIIPSITGLFRPKILLPLDVNSIDKKNLSYIFYHELYHFKSKDSWIKLGLEILCCILWWNPVIYFLKKGINHLLELRCDRNVCSLLTPEDKASYTETLVLIARNQALSRKLLMSEYTGKESSSKLKERFSYILNRQKQKNSRLSIFLLVLSIGLFVFSYSVTIQPYFEAPSVENDETVQDTSAFILRQEDGILLYFENGENRAVLTEDMLEQEPYYNIPVYDGY